MSKLAKLFENWSDLGWWRESAIPWLRIKLDFRHWPKENRHPRLYQATKLLHKHRQPDFVSIPDAGWDNLIILDAARYDVFREVNTLDGTLSHRYSQGPQTPLFLQNNFGDDEYHDIVYLSANPHQHKQLREDQFHAVRDLSKTCHDEERGTVPPDPITEAGLDAIDTYPDKRLIVHYLQPHAPFLSEWATEHIGEYTGEPETWPYARARRGEVTRDTIREAYRRDLEMILDHAARLVDAFDGKTVITSDHGELLGDRAWPFPWREYGHPRIQATKLLKTPWFVPEYEERRETVSDPPERDTAELEIDSEAIEDRLADLGYK